ncbi:hypothetical protein IIY68_03170 [Candidatus Saccharibacteria bacterium]|nr:hypothetical protein [Candidatus Saccharibacteria bacterium]
MSTNLSKKVATYEIVGGPSTDRLFDALRYAYDKDVKIPINFGIVIGLSRPKNDPGCCSIGAHSCGLRLTSIQHEDGSGCSFNIGGYSDTGLKKGPYSEPLYVGHKVKIYYNSKSREGHITFIKN